MRKAGILVVLFLLGAVAASGAAEGVQTKDTAKIFASGADYYQNGNYDSAQAVYEKLLSDGIVTPEIYYNLGNVYYKKNKLGRAILYYERALRLAPRDSDTHYNLDYARTFIKETAVSEDALSRLLNGAFNFLTLNGLALAFAVLFTLFMLAVIARIYVSTKLLNSIILYAGCVCLLIGIWLSLRIWENETRIDAIAITSDVEVRSGPGNDYSVNSKLPEGKKMEIIGERQDWYAVSLAAENIKGWARKKDIEKI